jgi:hypothetical protein
MPEHERGGSRSCLGLFPPAGLSGTTRGAFALRKRLRASESSVPGSRLCATAHPLLGLAAFHPSDDVLMATRAPLEEHDDPSLTTPAAYRRRSCAVPSAFYGDPMPVRSEFGLRRRTSFPRERLDRHPVRGFAPSVNDQICHEDRFTARCELSADLNLFKEKP